MTIPGLDAWLTTDPRDGGPCEVCGYNEDDCVCPECQTCGTIGDPSCYDSFYVEHRRFQAYIRNLKSHGMIETNEQAEAILKWELYDIEMAKAEQAYAEECGHAQEI